MITSKSTCAVLLASFLAANGAVAQTVKASLSGRLTTGSGDPIPNAVIVLCNADADLWFMTGSDANGSFELTDLPPNRFAVEVFSPQWRRGTVLSSRTQIWGYSPWSDTVALQAGQNLRRNIQLGGLILQPRPTQTTPPCTPRRPFLTLSTAALARLFIDGPEPVYPKATNTSTLEADVNLEAFMNKDGKVISLRLIVPSWPPKIDPAITKAAVEAIRNWRYDRPQVNFLPERLEFSGPIPMRFLN